MRFLLPLMVWGNVLSTGVDRLCFNRPKVSATVFQEIFEDIMLPFADQYYGDVLFEHLPTPPKDPIAALRTQVSLGA